MKILDIETVEQIVKNNPNLHWDGWNVICLDQDDYAEFLPTGVFDRTTGKWYRKKVYALHDDGTWTIPDEAIVR